LPDVDTASSGLHTSIAIGQSVIQINNVIMLDKLPQLWFNITPEYSC